MKQLSYILLFAFNLLHAQVEPVPTVSPTSNWTSAISYDLSGQTISKGVSFFNTLGKATQSQSWDLLTNRVWASEVRYDYFGRPALQTLSAPINNSATFGFRADFIRSNNSPISIGQYDTPSTIFNPPQISADQNTLGWYYSNQNNLDPYQDVTTYPYTRVIYSDLNPGATRAVLGGNKVTVGGQQQWLQSYSFTMAMEKDSGSSAFYNLFEDKKMLKTVSRSVEGVENVVFTDIEGNVLAAARSGFNDEGTQTQMSVYSQIFDKGFVDIHIPEGCGGDITISNISPSLHQLRVFDLITESIIIPSINVNGSGLQTTTINLNPGFYRIEDTKKHYLINNSSLPVRIAYRVNYYESTHNKYDLANRLIGNTPPLNSLSAGANLEVTFNYNSLGQLLETQSPDEGISKFKYRKDGQIRFSENSEQRKENKFSYTNYDELGRPIESGVYKSEGNNAIFFDNTDVILDMADGLDYNYKSEMLFSVYDFPDENLSEYLNNCKIPTKEYTQTFLSGNVSFTYTEKPFTTKTWYSYDVYGRVRWIIQEIPELSCLKTIDYEYHPINGQITKVLYQKHSKNDRFIHRYTYNIAGQLTDVETSLDNTTFSKQAHYNYNESGALIRTELAQNLQGIDYVYNLNGQLKAINHPSILPQNDPGNDGNNGFIGDVFGMAIDYYSGDYTRTGTPKPVSTISGGTDQFNGNIKAARWNTQVPSATQSAYTYQYNKNNWLTNASFGTVNATGVFAPNTNEDYKVSDITYDANGNIKTLNRNGYTDSNGNNAMDNFTYHYGQGAFANRLNYVRDTNDNSDPLRYDDLKDQYNTESIGSLTVTLPNYIYNDLGQLIINYQDNVIYQYNTSGLVKKINAFDNQDTGNYTTINNQDFSNGVEGRREWVSTTGPATGMNAIYYSDNPECPQLTNSYGNMLQLTGSGTRVKSMPASSNTFYKFDMDVIMDRKLFQELEPYDPNYIEPPIELFNAWAVINIKDDSGTVLATYNVNNQSVEYCNRFFDEQVSLGFTTPANTNSINIELTIYSSLPPLTAGIQRTFIDNIRLEAAISTKVAFEYNDRGQRVKKESYNNQTTYSTYYVRDAAGSVMAVYTKTAGPFTYQPLQVKEHSMYGSGRIGVFKRENTEIGGYALYELTDHLGNVRAVIMKSGGNVLSLTAKTDYYPFGMPMPNRHTTDNNYRYAFQGQEKDNETGMEAFELRLWDGRIGRWLTIDPYHEFFSPYLGMGNNPINLIDPDGGMTEDCPDCPGGKFDSGTEWLSSDGYTYMYDEEVFGGWSTFGNVTGTAHINTDKANSHAFAASLMLRSSVMMGTAASFDGPSPVGDLAGGTQWLMAGAVAGVIYLTSTFEQDYTLTFTTREPETILLYRGVHNSHPDYHNAVLGMATPKGFLDGHSDPVLHNFGDNNSIFTSWTILRSTAKTFADSHGPGGVILSKRFSIYEVVPSINRYNEGEFLVPGLVTGARVEKSVMFSK